MNKLRVLAKLNMLIYVARFNQDSIAKEVFILEILQMHKEDLKPINTLHDETIYEKV